MRTVILAFERLPACSLGCYGEWNIPTPEIDFLASRSLVLEEFRISPGYESLNDTLFLNWICDRTPALIHSRSLASAFVNQFPAALLLEPGKCPDEEQLQKFLGQTDADLLYIHFDTAPPSPEDVQEAIDIWSAVTGTVSVPSTPAIPAEDLPGTECAEVESLETLDSLPPGKQDLILHTADVLACDAALSRWLELLEDVLEPGDTIIVTAQSGDPRRVSDRRPEWLRSISGAVTHLPLILHHVGNELAIRSSKFADSVLAGKLCRARGSEEWVAILDQAGNAALQPDIPALATASAKIENEDLAAIEQNTLTVAQLRHSLPEGMNYCSPLAFAFRSRDWLIVESRVVDRGQHSGEQDSFEIRLFRKPEDVWEVHDLASQYPDLVDRYREERARSSRDESPEQDGV